MKMYKTITNILTKLLKEALGNHLWLNTAFFSILGTVVLVRNMTSLGIRLDPTFFTQLEKFQIISLVICFLILIFLSTVFFLTTLKTALRVLINFIITLVVCLFVVLLYVYLHFVVAQQTVFLTIPELGISFTKNTWNFFEMFGILMQDIGMNQKLLLPLSEIIDLVNKNLSPEGLIQAYDKTVELELLSRQMAKVQVPARNDDWLLYKLGVISLSLMGLTLVWVSLKLYSVSVMLDAMHIVQDEQAIAINSLSAECIRLAGAQAEYGDDVKTVRETMRLLTTFLRAQAPAP